MEQIESSLKVKFNMKISTCFHQMRPGICLCFVTFWGGGREKFCYSTRSSYSFDILYDEDVYDLSLRRKASVSYPLKCLTASQCVTLESFQKAKIC